MGSVKKEKNGTWAARYDLYVDGKRQQKMKRGFSLKADAAAFVTQMESSVLSGEYVIPSEVAFTAYVDDFVKRRYTDKVEAKSKSFNTEAFYKSLFNDRFKAYFEGRRLSEITTGNIEDYLTFLIGQKWKDGRRRLSDKTVWKHFKAICTVFAYAAKRKDVKDNPCDGAELPFSESQMKTVIRAKPVFWEPEIITNAEAIFAGTEIEWHVGFALRTGLREGEVCGLKESDIDFGAMTFTVNEQAQNEPGKGLVFVPPKSAASLDVLPMTDEIAQLAKAKILENKKNRLRYGKKYNRAYDGRLSLRGNGDFLNPKFLYHRYKKILEAHPEIPYIPFHGLRHTCAVWHIEVGTDMKTLQKLLRHAEYQVTVDTYADVSMRLKRAAMERLSLRNFAPKNGV
jgi:integrase